MLSARDIIALLPILVISATAVLVMMGIAWKRSHVLAAGLTLVGLAGAFLSIFAAVPLAPRQVTSLLLVDRFALFYMGLIIASAWVVAALSYDYFKNRDEHREELYRAALDRDCRVCGLGGEHSLCFLPSRTRDLERLAVCPHCVLERSK